MTETADFKPGSQSYSVCQRAITEWGGESGGSPAGFLGPGLK